MTRAASGLSLSAAMFVLGLLLSLSFFTQQHAKATTPRKDELLQAVKRLDHDRSVLRERLTQLRGDLSVEQAKLAREQGSSRDRSLLESRLKRDAGLVALAGPGVVVTLADASSVPADADPDDLIVHDYDIAAVINALSVGGAEAIALNGERLVWRSAVRSAGSTIMVEGRPVVGPYRLQAIGDSGILVRTLQVDSYTAALLQVLQVDGVSARYEVKDRLELPAYEGAISIEYARSVSKDAGMEVEE